MKSVRTTLLGLALVFGLVAFVNAADEEKTLKGTITCAKCDLKETKACATVIVVKDGDKKVTYYFDDAGSKKYHKNVCTEAKPGSVTGTVSEKDKKFSVKVKECKFD